MFFFFSIIAFTASTSPPDPWYPLPDPKQYKYHTEQLAAFIHFGINTFTGKEWGDGNEDPNDFRPTKLDTDQWVQVLKKSGFGRAVMVGKHHDGFCNWKTKFTNFSVNNSKDYQTISQLLHQSGDVLEEISKSCTKYNLDLGLYLSPWDVNSKYYGDDKLYNEYYMNLTQELLGNPKYGNNGFFTEVWMDNAKADDAKAQTYWFAKWFDLIYGLQPGCAIWSGYGSEIRWIGNENGVAGIPCWDKTDADNARSCVDKLPSCNKSRNDSNHGVADGQNYSVGECDVSMTDGWFWKKGKKPKTLKKLAEIYLTSVGRGQPVILNVPPDTDGKIPDEFVDRLYEWADAIRESFGFDFCQQDGVTVSASSVRGEEYGPQNVIDGSNLTYWTMNDGQITGSLTIDFGMNRTFNLIAIKEHIALGQRVSKYDLEYHSASGWKNLASSQTIGYRHIDQFDTVTGDGVRVTIKDSQAVPLIEEVGVYMGVGPFAEKLLLPTGSKEVKANLFKFSENWRSFNKGILTKSNDFASYEFKGNSFFLIGSFDPTFGKLNVFVDDELVSTVDCYSPEMKSNQLLYHFDGVLSSNVFHTIKLQSANGKAVQIASLNIIDNQERGIFEFTQREFVAHVNQKSARITIQRTGGSKGKATIKLVTASGSASLGKNFDMVSQNVIFDDGETKKTIDIPIQLGEYQNGIGDLNFFVKLIDVPESNGGIIGFKSSSAVIIKQ